MAVDYELKDFAKWLLDERSLSASTALQYVTPVRAMLRAAFRPDAPAETGCDRDALIRFVASLPRERQANARTAWRRFVEFAAAQGVTLPEISKGTPGRPMASIDSDLLVEALARCFPDPLDATKVRWGRWDQLTYTHAIWKTEAGEAQVPRPLLDAIRNELHVGRPENTLRGRPILPNPRDPEEPMAYGNFATILTAVRADRGRPKWKITDEALAAYGEKVKAEIAERYRGETYQPTSTVVGAVSFDGGPQTLAHEDELPPVIPSAGLDYLTKLKQGITGVAPDGQALRTDDEKEAETRED